jgi:hypothetical protein
MCRREHDIDSEWRRHVFVEWGLDDSDTFCQSNGNDDLYGNGNVSEWMYVHSE